MGRTSQPVIIVIINGYKKWMNGKWKEWKRKGLNIFLDLTKTNPNNVLCIGELDTVNDRSWPANQAGGRHHGGKFKQAVSQNPPSVCVLLKFFSLSFYIYHCLLIGFPLLVSFTIHFFLIIDVD